MRNKCFSKKDVLLNMLSYYFILPLYFTFVSFVLLSKGLKVQSSYSLTWGPAQLHSFLNVTSLSVGPNHLCQIVCTPLSML